MKKIIEFFRKFTFPTIIALSALSVSASAAFYSVTGLSKLFAGASFEVLIMAGSLEIAKLVIASLLYQYWGELNKLLRTYLTLAATVLVLITSAGIYGFLSAAYQETASQAGIVDKQIELIDLKKGRFEENRTYYLSEKEALDKSISELRVGLSNNVVQYKDRETGQIITTTSSSTRRALQKELDQAVESRNTISKKLELVTDSISSLEIKRLDVESNSEVASELGPLKYISELTDTPMSKVVNILMLVIIFVFDPLAISLVIAANFAFSRLKNIKEEDDFSDLDVTIEDGLEDVPYEESQVEPDIQDTNDKVEEDKITPSPEELETLEKYLKKMEESKRIQEERFRKELEKTKLNPTESDLERLQKELDRITKLKNESLDVENSENEVKLTEEEGEESEQHEEEKQEENIETPPSPPQPIRRLIYKKRDGRNTRFDRI